jgi:hypothetical protein
MGMFEMMTMASSGILMMILPGLALPFLYIYLVHDYAGRREGNRDPLLGSKVFTTLMMTVAGQLMLAGLAFIAVGLASEGDSSYLIKSGFGLELAGLVIGVFPTVLYYTRVRTVAGARVAHQALGLNALLAGIVFTITFVVACQGLVHSGDVAEPLAVAVIYGLAMIITGLRLQHSQITVVRIESERGD